MASGAFNITLKTGNASRASVDTGVHSAELVASSVRAQMFDLNIEAGLPLTSLAFLAGARQAA